MAALVASHLVEDSITANKTIYDQHRMLRMQRLTPSTQSSTVRWDGTGATVRGIGGKVSLFEIGSCGPEDDSMRRRSHTGIAGSGKEKKIK